MQEKPVEQVSLFIRDQITGRHLFNREALLALGINPAEAQERGFRISLPASALGSRIVFPLKTSADDHLGA
jgi:hypothetical protein